MPTTKQINLMHDIFKKNNAEYDSTGKVIYLSWDHGTGKEFEEKLGKDRKTMYNWAKAKSSCRPIIRERAPLKKGITPRYVAEFEGSKTVQSFKEKRKGTVTDKTFEGYKRTGMLAWKILKKKEPMDWTEEDYLLLWKHPTFRHSETGSIAPKKASALIQWMKHCKRYDLTQMREFRDVEKPESGKHLESWLKSKEELEDVIRHIQYPDTLMMFNLGIQCGGRFGSLALITPEKIDYGSNAIYMKEPKVKKKKPPKRIFIDATLANLQKYVAYFDFKPKQKIFPRKLEFINDDLKQAGEKANIPFTLTSHKAMKHTYVSLASNSGIPLDIVSLYTGTDPATLMEFYAGIGEDRIRTIVLGKEQKFEPFYDVMEDIQGMVSDRYEEIKHNLVEINGLAKKPRKKTTPKPEKLKPIPWKAHEKMIKKYRGLSQKDKKIADKNWGRTIPNKIKALKLHRQGKTDTEVRKIMGWKTEP